MRRIPFVALLVAGSVVFDLFVTWYDTGRWASNASLPVAMSTVALTSGVMLVNPRRMGWLLWVMISTLIISLSFGVGSGWGGGLLGILTIALFYLPMSLPFGLVVGLIGHWLLRKPLRAIAAT